MKTLPNVLRESIDEFLKYARMGQTVKLIKREKQGKDEKRFL